MYSLGEFKIDNRGNFPTGKFLKNEPRLSEPVEALSWTG